jgi:hypothetical protein
MMQWAAIEEDEMRRLMMVGLAAGIGLGACQTLPAETAPATAPMPAPPPPDASFIPAGTVLNVELNTELKTTSRVGDTFTVTVTEPLIATNAQVVVPEGAVITGMVTGVGAVRGEEPAAIRLNFLRINIRGISHPLTAEIASTHVPMQEHAGHDAARAAATGAAAGAVLGAILTGELRDALIGAALGAGAGTIISLGTGDVEAVLPEGTRMTIRTFDRISLR